METADRHLTSSDVAAKLGVSVATVYKLSVDSRRRLNAFPAPVAFRGRSPLYSEAAIDAFIELRDSRPPSARGRRSRTELLVDDGSFASRLRRAVADGTGLPDIPTQNALATLLGLNLIPFGERMRGHTRWTAAELELINHTLGIDTSDANDMVDARRREKARARDGKVPSEETP